MGFLSRPGKTQRLRPWDARAKRATNVLNQVRVRHNDRCNIVLFALFEHEFFNRLPMTTGLKAPLEYIGCGEPEPCTCWKQRMTEEEFAESKAKIIATRQADMDEYRIWYARKDPEYIPHENEDD